MTTTPATHAACIAVASWLLAACGSSIDADNASIAAAQESGPPALRTASSNDEGDRRAAVQPRPCESDGRIVCSMPRLRARSLRAEWVALHHPQHRDGADVPGADQAARGAGGTDWDEAPARYGTLMADGSRRTFHLGGVAAVVGAHKQPASR